MKNMKIKTPFIVIVVPLVIALFFFCIVPSSWGLELHYGGRTITYSPRTVKPVSVQEKHIQVDLRSQGYGTSVSGDVNRSFINDGIHYENLLSFRYAHPFQSTDKVFRIWTDLSNTDDDTIQDKKVKFLGMGLEYGREKVYKFRAGDITLRGKKYTFQRSMEGASYNHYFALADGGLKTQVGFGQILKPEESVSFRRLLLAGDVDWERHLKHPLVKRLKFNMGYARAWDEEGSIKEKNALTPDENEVWGLGMELKLWANVMLNTEFALSSYQDDSSSDTIEDQALAVALEKRFGFGFLRVRGEEVSPDFRSLAGSASPDTRRLSGNFSTHLGRSVTVSTFFNRYEDNVDNTKEFTTTSDSPSLFLSIHPFRERRDNDFIKNLQLNSTLAWTLRKADDDSLDRDIFRQSYTLSNAIGDWRIRTGYDIQKTEDKITVDNNRCAKGWEIGFSNQQIIGDLVSKMSRNRWIKGGLNVSWNRKDDDLESEPGRNKHYTIRVGSSGEILQQISYGLNFSIQDADFASGTNDYHKHSWDISLDRRLERFRNLSLGIMLHSLSNKDEESAKTYKEHSYRLHISMIF